MRRSGFLARLARDTRGNALAMCAAAVLPLVGMVGGAVDMSRLYITRTRLQHACDAGVLAGRKQMGGGAWTTAASNAALQFFDGNFTPTAYGTTTRTRSFSENTGRVSGDVTAVVPMTLMKVFSQPDVVVSVKCAAQMQLPNTDVMFVLDTTGSMNCVAGDTTCPNGNNDGKPAAGSKIDGLKTAVKCFYEIVAQEDTNATCDSTPSGGVSSQVQVRFGFVPYSSNVNVGRLLPNQYIADTAEYQTRTREGTSTGWGDWFPNLVVDWGGYCPSTYTSGTYSLRNGTVVTYNGRSYCQFEWRQSGPYWNYGKQSISLSTLKTAAWPTTGPKTFTLPIGDDGGSKTINWQGCIEERTTASANSYNPIPASATDLDIDAKPDTGTNRWKPALYDAIFYRGVPNLTQDYSRVSNSSSFLTYNNFADAPVQCTNESRLLQVWSGASAFQTYVDGLTASGNTYHDIGMVWGARLMSPTGIFGAQNLKTPSGGQITRHMIFMTDGDSTSNPCDYNAYGVPWFDKRQTTDTGDAVNCGTNRQALIDQINLRLEGLCEAVKGKGITLWVISYGGTGINAATKKRLETCASPPDTVAPTHYFDAANAPQLRQNFATIANAISQLRLMQ